jgi:hypothetical protein
MKQAGHDHRDSSPGYKNAGTDDQKQRNVEHHRGTLG